MSAETIAQADTLQTTRIDLEAAGWIERRDFGAWTDDARAEFETWLEKAPEHRVAFLRLDAGWERAEIIAALRPMQAERRIVAPRRSWPFRKIVAGFALAAVIAAAGVAYTLMPSAQVYATNVGGHKVIALADGSRIELNTDTLLHVSETSKQRIVRLERGEIYLQIHHDASRPFIVEAGRYRVTDLGTEFSMRRAGAEIEVALVEGRTRLETDGVKGQSAELAAGDVAVARNGAVSVVRRPISELAYSLAWRRGLLIFHNTALGDAVTEFNRYNADKLVVGDLDAGKLRINGTFPIHDVAIFARVARDVFGLRIANSGNGTVISR